MSLDFALAQAVRQPLPLPLPTMDAAGPGDDRPRVMLICRDGLSVPDLPDYLRASGFGIEEQTTLPPAPAEGVEAVLLVAALGEPAVFEFLRVSAATATPVVVLSPPAETVLRILALELGAADVIDQGASFREVLARLRALLRRQAVGAASPASRSGTPGGWRLDRRARCLRTPDGTVIRLARGEFDLISDFVASDGGVLDYGPIPERRRMTVSRFARRLRRDYGLDTPIENVRGRGYRFRPELGGD